MSGIGNFLRNYEFLNLTKSVTESKLNLYKEPNKTWSQFGNKLCLISWYNGLSFASVGVDVTTYLAVSTLRSVGLFCPLPPEPPVFPAPHDNVQFIDCAIKRAVWDWDRSERKEIEEAIESNFSDKWNIYQVVGEWSFAYSLENGSRSSYFKPTFLTISEPLENGASFRSIETDFGKLWQSEKKAILNALYHQSEPPSLGYKAKKVYQDIRALASQLHQGNLNYLTAFSGYVSKKDAEAASIPSSASSVSFSPSAPAYSVAPSAPPRALIEQDIEIQMAANVGFLRRAFLEAPQDQRAQIKSDILKDSTSSSDFGITKYRIARLALLYAFENPSKQPSFFPWNQALKNGKTLRQTVEDFGSLETRDIMKLREAVLSSYRGRELNASLQAKLNNLNEFGMILAQNKDFQKVYDALRIDLLVA